MIRCGYCGDEINKGEEYGVNEGGAICGECAWNEIWRLPLDKKFEILGFATQTYGDPERRSLDDE